MSPLSTLVATRFALPLSQADLGAMGLRGLHCGSGATFHLGLLNIDLMPFRDVEGQPTQPGRIYAQEGKLFYLQHDQTTPYPIESGSVDAVFSEHFIEHINIDQAVNWLREVYRMLRPGGIARISTPDLALYATGYSDPQQHFYRQHQQQLQRMGMGTVPARPAWMLNQIFRYYGHQWIYDWHELVAVSAAAGFDSQQVRRCSYRSGEAHHLAQLDQEQRSDESLYVELVKS